MANNEEPELTHELICRLSRVFNGWGNAGTDADHKINEWLKYQISLRFKPEEKR